MKIVSYVVNVFGKLFRCKVKTVGKPLGSTDMNEKKTKKPYSIPELRKNYYQDPEVVILSYYLKTLGVNQNLNAGDIYYVKSEEGLPKAWIYTKNEPDTVDEFEFMTSGNYFRMVTQEEAMTLIRFCGYSHEPVNGISVEDSGTTTISVGSPTLQTSLTVCGANIHATYLKAAYLVAANNKSLADANDLIETDSFFNNVKINGGL